MKRRLKAFKKKSLAPPFQHQRHTLAILCLLAKKEALDVDGEVFQRTAVETDAGHGLLRRTRDTLLTSSPRR